MMKPMLERDHDPELDHYLSRVEHLDLQRSHLINTPVLDTTAQLSNTDKVYSFKEFANSQETAREYHNDEVYYNSMSKTSSPMAYKSAYNYEKTFSPKMNSYSTSPKRNNYKDSSLQEILPILKFDDLHINEPKRYIVSEEDYRLLQKIKRELLCNETEYPILRGRIRQDKRNYHRKSMLSSSIDGNIDTDSLSKLPMRGELSNDVGSSPSNFNMTTNHDYLRFKREQSSDSLRNTLFNINTENYQGTNSKIGYNDIETEFIDTTNKPGTYHFEVGSDFHEDKSLFNTKHWVDPVLISDHSKTVKSLTSPMISSVPSKTLEQANYNENKESTVVKLKPVAQGKPRPVVPPKKSELQIPKLNPINLEVKAVKNNQELVLPKLRSPSRSPKRNQDIPEAIKMKHSLRKPPSSPEKTSAIPEALQQKQQLQKPSPPQQRKVSIPEALKRKNQLNKAPFVPQRKISMPEALKRAEELRKRRNLDSINNILLQNQKSQFNNQTQSVSALSMRNNNNEIKPSISSGDYKEKHVSIIKDRVKGPKRKLPSNIQSKYTEAEG